MNRRDTLLSLLVLGSVAMPLPASAQQSNRIYRIGFLSTRSPPTPTTPSNIFWDTFRQRLRELGYIEGKNLKIEWRFANGIYERLPELAAELAAMKVDVIFTTNTPGTLAAKRATSTIPIVFGALADPIGGGVVRSLARPEGNVTGLSLMTVDAIPKQVELLASAIPRLSRIALLMNPLLPHHKTVLENVQAAAQKIGAKILDLEARNLEEIELGFVKLTGWTAQALIIENDAVFQERHQKIIEIARKYRVPTMFSYSQEAEAGGLFSYGQNITDLYRRAAGYVDKILKGAKPSDLPIEQPMTFEFVINLKTAKTLDIKIPPAILMRADRVIE